MHVQCTLYLRNALLWYSHYRLENRNRGSCSLTLQFNLGFVVTISILCNPFTGSLSAGHSITPSLAVFSMTNRCVPAKLFLNKWMCFLQRITRPDLLFFFCWTKQTSSRFVTSEVYCISHFSGNGYFSGRQIDTSVADSLLAALQISCFYLYIVCPCALVLEDKPHPNRKTPFLHNKNTIMLSSHISQRRTKEVAVV